LRKSDRHETPLVEWRVSAAGSWRDDSYQLYTIIPPRQGLVTMIFIASGIFFGGWRQSAVLPVGRCWSKCP